MFLTKRDKDIIEINEKRNYLYRHICTRCIITVFLVTLSAKSATAQVQIREDAVGVQYSLLPVFGYKSDLGFMGGGLLQRIDYGEGTRPFRTATSIEMTITTKGHLVSVFDHERLNSFGTDIRSRIRVEGLRILRNTFFGVGNQTEFSDQAYENGYYYFEDRTFLTRYWGRKNLVSFGENGKIDVLILASVSYTNPLSRGEETLFHQMVPSGAEGGWANQAGAGWVIDNRDSEFDPRKGYRLETNLTFSGRWTGSDSAFTSYRIEARGYLSPFRDLVIAQKLEARHTTGKVPFWEMPVLGDEMGLRGYVNNRFLGDSSVLHIAEARIWLFRLFDDQLRLGGHIFIDTGRVFSGEDNLRDLTTDLKQTFGFGGAMSVMNSDFIFRGDIALSEDTYRIYFGVGYLF